MGYGVANLMLGVSIRLYNYRLQTTPGGRLIAGTASVFILTFFLVIGKVILQSTKSLRFIYFHPKVSS
jgi:hypothetical protein